METCVLLHRVQTFQASRLEPSLFTAVDSADEDRYQLVTTYERHKTGLDGLSLY